MTTLLSAHPVSDNPHKNAATLLRMAHTPK